MSVFKVSALFLALASTIRAQDTSPGASTQPNIAENCNAFYTIPESGDCFCDCVEQKFDITHDQFIEWNPDVSSDCSQNFWTGYAYCVGVGDSQATTTTEPATTTTSKATTSTSKSAAPTSTSGADPSPDGPTQPNIAEDCNAFFTIPSSGDCFCDCVESKFDISHNDFLEWNPDVSSDCSQNYWTGYAYCVGVGPSQAPNTTTASKSSTSKSAMITSTANATYSIRNPITSWNISSTAVETAFPPQKTQSGIAADCIDWYFVDVADTCEKIIGYSTWIDEAAFHAANPALGDNCENLLVGYWVCIRTQPSASFSFPYTTSAGNASVPAPTAFTSPTFPTADTSFTASPTAGAVADDCKEWYLAKENDSCLNVPQIESGLISQQQFFDWNPALNDSCAGMWVDYYYCAVAGTNVSIPAKTTRPAAIPTGQAANCNRWYQASGYETCDDIVLLFGTFDSSEFISWNPSVGSSCSNIKADTNYCVGIPGTPTSRSSTPSVSFPTSAPTQSGVAADCSDFWQVSSSDTCDSIVASNGISEDDFFSWNPAVGSDCSGLEPDTAVCVAAGS